MILESLPRQDSKASIQQGAMGTPRSLASSAPLGFTHRKSLRTPELPLLIPLILVGKQNSVKLKDTLSPLWTRMTLLLGSLLGIPELRIPKTGIMPQWTWILTGNQGPWETIL